MEHTDPKEEDALRKSLEDGLDPSCPRCGSNLHPTPIPPRSDVSYVRNRIMLACRQCPYRVVVDRP